MTEKELTKDDVWGIFDIDKMEYETTGMMVGSSSVALESMNVCPIWGDTLKYKSATFVCEREQELDVIEWLEYVHGGGCISRRKVLPDGKIALRSDYQCW